MPTTPACTVPTCTPTRRSILPMDDGRGTLWAACASMRVWARVWTCEHVVESSLRCEGWVLRVQACQHACRRLGVDVWTYGHVQIPGNRQRGCADCFAVAVWLAVSTGGVTSAAVSAGGAAGAAVSAD
eukprot:366272-Chlamydomonas_euryale.AAC.4